LDQSRARDAALPFLNLDESDEGPGRDLERRLARSACDAQTASCEVPLEEAEELGERDAAKRKAVTTGERE
jgi:hypothetical protein